MSTAVPKVILDKQFVAEYLLKQKNITSDEKDDLAHNVSIISLHSSDDDDDSVVFVNEKPATSESKQIAKLNQQISSLQHRNNCLKIHVGALQSKILIDQANGDSRKPIPENAEKTEEMPNESVGHDIELEEEWVREQLAEIGMNGQFPQVFGEIDLLLNNES